MRKAAALIVTAALALALCGCAALLEGERSTSREHQSIGLEDPGEGEAVLDADNYEELFDAVKSLIEMGAERGTIRMVTYDGDMEEDLADAVITAANATPEGAYCVYYINYSLNRLVTVYEASLSIIYRHTPEEAAAVETVRDYGELESVLTRAMEARSDNVTVRVSGGDTVEADIERAVERGYYSNPGTILYIPTYTVTAYPEGGDERIIEVNLSYPYATQTVEARRRSLDSRAEEILASVRGGTAGERILSLGEVLTRNVTYDDSVNSSDLESRRYNAMTAYGAIVQGSAVGEGYAMATKLLCDKLGVECHVVRGRYNNMDHAWNIVRLDEGLYHVDMSRFDPVGMVFRNDEQQIALNYWWEEEEYPECAGRSLYEVKPDDADAGENPPEDEAGA